MKIFILLLSTILISSHDHSTQDSRTNVEGAWQTSVADESGASMTKTLLIKDGYFSLTKYSILQQKFDNTRGGKLEITDDGLIFIIEYDTSDPSKVGMTENHRFKISENNLTLSLDQSEWKKVRQMDTPELSGAFLITGRKRNGELSRRTPGPRKTMKILAGPYFQWIAYNTDTGEFFGTGGGTYSAKEGTYSEQIEFFSRDGSRVGAILNFEFTIENEEWHHSGLSSKGSPIYEIWTPRANIE